MSKESTPTVSGAMKTPGAVSSEKGIHAVLIEQSVGLSELWLPATVEGRYTFPIADDLLAIVAQDSCWKACILHDGYFSLGEDGKAKEIFLQNNSLTIAYIGNKVFSLYMEEDSDSVRQFQPYYVERNMDILIGRESVCDIWFDSCFASREHALLKYVGETLTITDQNSKNGVYVNGQQVHSAALELGDVVYIMGLCIIVGAGYIAMNYADKCRITTRRVIPLNKRGKMTYLIPRGGEEGFYDRKPRKKYKLEQRVIEIEQPPNPLPKTKIPLALRMSSSAIMGGQALMTGNVLGAVTSAVLPSLTQGLTEKDRKDYETRREERYREYLQAKEQEIAQEIIFEESFFNDIFPDFDKTLDFVTTQTRLWERRKIDDDFLTVRLGKGTIPMAAEKKYSPRTFEMEPDFLQDEMYAMVEQPSLLHNVPITVSLAEDRVLGIVGDPERTMQMVIQMISYIAITHAYDDVKMIVLASESMKEQLAFTKYLQHFWNNDHTVRFYATNTADMQVIAKYLREQDILGEEKKKSSSQQDTKRPAYLVFALDKDLFEQSELFKELLQKGEECGVSTITAFGNAPKECTKLIDFRGGSMLVDLNHPEAVDIALTLDPVNPEKFRNSMNRLSQINLLMDDDKSFSLPSMITFLEMFGVGRVEHLNPLSRWETNNPVKSLAAPVGVGTDGKLFTLDLHEKHQGPHGLVAGMTGSGKSEFIITYLLSMAVNFSPDEVSFVLIDYKGGGLADAFVDPKRGIHLPHVVATITNLDGAAIQRSLVSIHSELSRRQEMFKRAKSETGEGTMDIYDYQRLYRNKRVSEPMPHLIIVSDEFAELKKQQPEFMDALISAARIGRSLGVHLILATQKPGGVVNDQIWSNTKFRACLKVQDRTDSTEMLKRPEAAELKQTGRFYLQVGYNEFFALGQSAWCGAGYVPQEKIVKEVDSSIQFLDNSGQVILNAKEKKVQVKAESKQIVAIVKYLSDLAKREGIVPKSLWRNPLPAHMEYHDLAKMVRKPAGSGVSALMGLVDDPEHQKQFPLFLDLNSFHHMGLYGTAGSGKSNFFKTMLYSLVTNYTPEDVNFYILDLSGGMLSTFRHAPHCGAYLTKENEADFDRMLALIDEIVEQRKALFAEAEVYSYDDYIKVNKLPAVLVVLDGWTNIMDFVKGQQYSLGIAKNMRNAANYGVHFMFSANHLSEISARVKQEIDYKIALQAEGKFGYNDILGLRNATVPPEMPGRGLCDVEGRALEYHVAMPYCRLDVQQQSVQLKEALQQRSAQLQNCKPAKSLPVMDDELEYADFCRSFSPDRIPLGFSMQTMEGIAIPLQQLFTMGMYFGNPLGVKPILFNLLSAFRRENAEVIIVRRSSGTIFDRRTEEEVRAMYGDRYRMMDSDTESLTKLFEYLISENIPQYRVPPRNEYCEMHGIPATDRGRTVKAAKYIRSKTTPLLVLFEGFADIIANDPQKAYADVFSSLKGFNIYFAGGFYPGDDNNSSHATFRAFNKEDFSLLFGGQFHKQWLTSLANEFRSMEKVNPNYNRFLMRYHNACHRMVMPSGVLLSADEDPDEKDII